LVCPEHTSPHTTYLGLPLHHNDFTLYAQSYLRLLGYKIRNFLVVIFLLGMYEIVSQEIQRNLDEITKNS